VTGRRLLSSVALFAASLGVLLVRWLVPGPVGAADNGDAWRLLCPLGATPGDRILEDWVQMAYGPTDVCESGYVSSQTWLLRLARWSGGHLGSAAALDLYVLGAITCVLAALAVTVLTLALPLTTHGRLVATGLLLLVLTDSAVFGWLVSVLSEGVALLGITLTAGGLLLLQRSDRWRWAGAVVTTVGAVLAANAKAQTLVLVPVLALTLLAARKPGTGLARRWALPVAVLLVTSAVTALVQLSGSPAGREFSQVNAYHAIFHNIVREESAADDLAELGLPRSWARYEGSQWWGDEPTAYQDPLWGEYQHLVTRRVVAEYYLTHPLRTVGVLQDGARDLLTARPDNIGSYPPDAGEPAGAQEHRVPVLSGLTRLVAPLGLFALVPIWLLTAAGAATAWRRFRPLAVVTGFVVVAGVGQFAVGALGEGIEGVKHQVPALFCTLLAAALAGICLLARRWSTVRRDEDAGPPLTRPDGVARKVRTGPDPGPGC
jgi:hypothetical protein